MNIKSLGLLLILIVLCGCSKEESKYLEEKTEISINDNDLFLSNTEHNQWIYNQMSELYFWYKDMPKSDELNFGIEPENFFKKLLSNKDRFSWCEINSNYQGVSSTSYATLPDEIGFEYQAYQDMLHNTVYEVLYITEDEVFLSGIARGDWLKVVSQTGDSFVFEKGIIRNDVFVATTENIVISLAATRSNKTVYMDSIYIIGQKKIGYMVYLEFDEKIDIIPTFKYFKQNNINELILDLRYNPGGYVSTCSFLSALIVKNSALGKPFQLQEYNDIQSSFYYTNYGDSVLVENIPNSSVAVQNNLNLNKLYVITSNHTASASEAVIIGLRPYMDVIVIGDVTTGKGVGSHTIANSAYKYQLQPITFRYYNMQHQTVPDEGLIPDYHINETYSKLDLGNINEPLLNVSLSIVSGNNAISNTFFKATSSVYSRLTKIGDASFVRKYKEHNIN